MLIQLRTHTRVFGSTEQTMYEVNDKELKAVQQLPAAARYQYFLEKSTDWQELWSIADDRGWVLMADATGTELVPVWPAQRFASVCCAQEWQTSKPLPISLSDWLTKWTPGMIADVRAVTVFPLPTDRGIVVTPERLKCDIELPLEAYGSQE